MDTFVSKDNNVIIFSGNGLRGVNGNISSLLKAWLEYKKKPSLKGYVLSLKNEKFPGITTIHPLSLKGLQILLKAKTAVISHGPDDLFFGSLSKRKRIINVWHGVPLKRIGPWTKWKNQTLISASESERKVLAEITGVEMKDIVVTGFPRTDSLIKSLGKLKVTALKKLKSQDKGQKYILYTPTYRHQNEKSGYIHHLSDFSFKNLNSILENHDAYLIVRSHINEPLDDFKKSKRIIFANFDLFPDVEPLYALADLLITDYSSSIFEYSLLNRPMIGVYADILEYKKNPGLVFDYPDIFPGPKAKDWKELKTAIDGTLSGKDEFSAKRREFSRTFNKFQDGKCTIRVLDIITKRKPLT